MSKAKERAWEAYPDYPTMDGGYVTQRKPRKVFIQGYQQAEKDLALTWKDVAHIVILADTIMDDHDEEWRKLGVEAYYTAVLKAYNDAKH